MSITQKVLKYWAHLIVYKIWCYWTKAIEDNGLVWPNVISGTDGQAVKEYSIIAIPTAVLIDCKTGEIVEYKMANYKLEDFLRKNLK